MPQRSLSKPPFAALANQNGVARSAVRTKLTLAAVTPMTANSKAAKAKRHVVVKLETISLTQAVENLHPIEQALMGRCP